MAGTRSSARQAAASSSSPNLSQSKVNGSASSKRKAETTSSPKSKRGKKGDAKEQKTIEQTMGVADDTDAGPKDVEMTDEAAHGDGEKSGEESPEKAGKENLGETGADVVDAKDKALHKDKAGDEDMGAPPEANKAEISNGDTQASGDTETEAHGKAENKTSKMDDTGKVEPTNVENGGAQNNISDGGAVEISEEREESTPSSIIEKGIIYFFFRGRVGIDNPTDVNDIARSYLVLRPLPHGAKLSDGPIGDDGNNRLLALPKKVLPISAKDRFMIFVDRAKSSMEDIKNNLSGSDYATKTAGSRHTPAATPIAEGVYALTTTGRESHLAYILTIPEELSEVQKDVGLRQRGSFVCSIKNPQYAGPANTNLPEGPGYPQEILDEFRSLRWMPMQPKHLDYSSAQCLIIGEGIGELGKATEQQPSDEKHDKDTPLEEMEKLEHEDEIRVKHLKGDDAVFEDLGLNHKEYPKLQTTW